MVIKKLKAKELKNNLSTSSASGKSRKKSKKSAKPSTDSAELPSKKTFDQNDEVTIVTNEWDDSSENEFRVKKIVYFRGGRLNHLNVVHSSEPKDVIRIKYHGIEYLLRKTAKDVAKAVMRIYPKIKNYVENIVGYLTTVTGVTYLISKVNKAFFSLNAELSSKSYTYTNPRFLDEESKISILERIVENLIKLNKKNLLLNNFSTNNIFYSGKSAFIGDLRELRMSLKPHSILQSFKSLIRQLLRMGVITKEEATYLIAYYMGGNPDVCYSWYKERYSEDADEVAVLEALERATIVQPA